MNYIKYCEGYKYQLKQTSRLLTDIYPPEKIQTEWITLDTDGLLTVFNGYAWDGASGPTFDSKSSMRGSLGHDGLYQLMRLGLLDRKHRPAADRLFHRLCIEDGMWKWRADAWLWAVENFAADATLASSEPVVQSAP